MEKVKKSGIIDINDEIIVYVTAKDNGTARWKK